MTLEPSLVLLVEPPALVFECLCCKVLLIGTLLVVEDIEERVRVDAGIQSRIVKYRQWLTRKLRVRVELDIRVVVPGHLCVQRLRFARL